MTLTGVVGRVEWHDGAYAASFVAAAIEGYTVTHTAVGWMLVARIVASDAFKLRQRPLCFVAPHARGRWLWPIVEHEIVNGQLRARLGPPLSDQEKYGTVSLRSA